MDPVQTMPSMDALTKKAYAVKEWLMYYKNVWTRNLAARLIDVANDTTLKAKNPDEEVTLPTGHMAPVKQRLEERKLLVQDAVDLLASVEALLALDDDVLAATYGEEALKVADDMLGAEADAALVDAAAPGTIVVAVGAKETPDGQAPKFYASKEFAVLENNEPDTEAVEAWRKTVLAAQEGLTDENTRVLFMSAESAAQVGLTPEPAAEAPGAEAAV